MITLKDVAREAGFDFRSASQILNGKGGRYRPETRERIQEAAQRLGYRPNAVARSLKEGKTYSVGVVGHFINSALNLDRLRELSCELDRLDYGMFFAGYEFANPHKERKAIEDLLARRVDGLVIFNDQSSADSDAGYYESLRTRGVPIVLDARFSHPNSLPVVAVDTVSGMREATRHLIELGHRDIAYPVGADALVRSSHRVNGFRRVLEEHGLPVRQSWLMDYTPHANDAVWDFTVRVMRENPRPTAIMYMDDDTALTGLLALREMGFRVPEDVSVVGFNDVPIAREVARPRLTTVRQPTDEVAREAVRLLMAQIDGKPNPPSWHVLVRSQLVVRQSSGPLGKARAVGRKAVGGSEPKINPAIRNQVSEIFYSADNNNRGQ